ncbi:MAG: sarcosine oxidase subunit delta [Gammaproteobacteria bacterium]|nr:sarcosine oxidase subunit delta [Gammaproteobacteria bacterium]
MKTIHCPVIGPRPLSEFTVTGVSALEPEFLGDSSAGAWVFNRDGSPMVRSEWWYHRATQLWFKVQRHTGTDQIVGVELARTNEESG